MNEFETYKMPYKERALFELLEQKLDRIIELLERQGTVRPG
jgi:hypothetical protein